MNDMERQKFLDDVRRILRKGRSQTFSFVCSELKALEDRYNWVGIYVRDGDKLVLESYKGEKTQHEQISLGDGLCSLAVLKNEIVNEADVKSNAKYLACFPSTESELVVPIRKNGSAVGEIDIDSDTRNAFSLADEKFITDVADLLGAEFF